MPAPDRPRQDRRPDGGGARGSQRSRQRPSERSKQAEPARLTAYTLLRAVADGAYANLELPAILRRHRLDARDAAFATELAFGTLRMQGFYDAVIEQAAGRPTSKVDSGVLDVLRLGDDEARALGLHPARSRLVVVTAATLITAAAVSVSTRMNATELTCASGSAAMRVS